VTSGLRPLPEWKRNADALFVQVSFSLDDLLTWRESVSFAGPVYAGVMVIASAPMGRKLADTIPQLAVPNDVIDRVERDRSAGVEIACQLVEAIRESGAFEGVHLIPVSKYREVAGRLEPLL
jgi:methylenetetrahydrofolate reductase (NADPH)